MARPESQPKTPLAGRLRELRRAIGDPERDEVAAKIGVGKSTLASYERGESEPSASALAAYKSAYGADVIWIITGEGSMFADTSKAPPPKMPIDHELMEVMYQNIKMVHEVSGFKTPDRRLRQLAAEMYNELLGRVSDIRDQAVVGAVLPVLADELKTRLQEAASEPGTGKRSAS